MSNSMSVTNLTLDRAAALAGYIKQQGRGIVLTGLPKSGKDTFCDALSVAHQALGLPPVVRFSVFDRAREFTALVLGFDVTNLHDQTKKDTSSGFGIDELRIVMGEFAALSLYAHLPEAHQYAGFALAQKIRDHGLSRDTDGSWRVDDSFFLDVYQPKALTLSYREHTYWLVPRLTEALGSPAVCTLGAGALDDLSSGESLVVGTDLRRPDELALFGKDPFIVRVESDMTSMSEDEIAALPDCERIWLTWAPDLILRNDRVTQAEIDLHGSLSAAIGYQLLSQWGDFAEKIIQKSRGAPCELPTMGDHLDLSAQPN